MRVLSVEKDQITIQLSRSILAQIQNLLADSAHYLELDLITLDHPDHSAQMTADGLREYAWALHKLLEQASAMTPPLRIVEKATRQ